MANRQERKQEREEQTKKAQKAQAIALPQSLEDALELTKDGQQPIAPDTMDAMLCLLADGNSLAKICDIKGMPNKYAFMKMCNASNVYSEALTRAREMQADSIIMQTIDIADEIALDSASVSRNALRITARARLAGFYNKKFNESAQQAEALGGVVAGIITAARSRLPQSVTTPPNPKNITPIKQIKGS